MAGKRYNKATAEITLKQGLESNITIFRESGVDENFIIEYQTAEKEWFNNERRFYEKTVSMTLYDDNLGYPEENEGGLDEIIDLADKDSTVDFELQQAKTYNDIRDTQKLNRKKYPRWIESLENIERQEIIMSFSVTHVSILTKVTQRNMTFEEIAVEMKTTRQRVSRMYNKVVEELKPVYEDEYIKAQKRYDARTIRKAEIKAKKKSSKQLLNVEKR